MIFGITGPAGAGKDTVADYLVARHGFTKMSFAGPLKEMMAVIGMPEPKDRALKEQTVPGFDFTWREAAQLLGTEWGRRLDPDIWIKIVKQRIEHAKVLHAAFGPGLRIVLSDVRFENEASMIRGLGGRVLHLHGRRVALGASAGHASEAGLRVDFSTDAEVWNVAELATLFWDCEIALDLPRKSAPNYKEEK